MQKQVIILFGPPGAGKGTQGELLSENLNLYYLETSKILENKFREAEELSLSSKDRFIKTKQGEYDILEEKKLWAGGKLCDPAFVSYLMKEKIKELAKEGKNLVLAGSPRTLYEAQEVTPLLEKLYGASKIKIILINISSQETIFRNSHRRICELMRHPILYNEETKNLKTCPLDGSKLLKREGLDDPETIKIRLKEYAERTAPIFDYLKKQGYQIKEIKGEQSVADVFKDLLKALK